MKSSLPLFLIALLCVATTMSPAVADTPTVPSAAVNPLIDRLRQEAPGARMEAAFERMRSDFGQGANAYYGRVGTPPLSLADIQQFGLLPFALRGSDGRPLTFAMLDSGATPVPDQLHFRLREQEGQLLLLGADGDPLAPMLGSVQFRSFMPTGIGQIFDWEDTLISGLTSSVSGQLNTYFEVHGTLPSDWAEVQALIPLVPNNHRTLTPGMSPHFGIQVAVDPIHATIRVTRFPDLGYGTVSYSRADSRGYFLRDISQAASEQTYHELYAAEITPLIAPNVMRVETALDPHQLDQLKDFAIPQDLWTALNLMPALTDSQFPQVLAHIPTREDGSVYPIKVQPQMAADPSPTPESVRIVAGGPNTWSVYINGPRDEPAFHRPVQRMKMASAIRMAKHMLWSEPGQDPAAMPPSDLANQGAIDWAVLRYFGEDTSLKSTRQITAAVSCAVLIQHAQRAEGTAPSDWGAFLNRLELAPSSYRSLPISDNLPAEVRCFEVATLESSPLIRVAYGIPGIGIGRIFVASLSEMMGFDALSWIFVAEGNPSLETLPWRTVVRGEMIPIPSPEYPEATP